MLKKGSELFKTYFEPVRKDSTMAGRGGGVQKFRRTAAMDKISPRRWKANANNLNSLRHQAN
jgi:hypothetical protein